MIEEFLTMHAEQNHEVELLEFATRNLEAKLNAMFEACNTLHQMVMGSNFGAVFNKEVKMNFKELRVICQPTNPKILQDAEIEEMALELQRKVHQIIFEDSSAFEGEDVKNGANLKMGRLRPHYNHFSTLSLVEGVENETTESLIDFEE